MEHAAYSKFSGTYIIRPSLADTAVPRYVLPFILFYGSGVSKFTTQQTAKYKYSTPSYVCTGATSIVRKRVPPPIWGYFRCWDSRLSGAPSL